MMDSYETRMILAYVAMGVTVLFVCGLLWKYYDNRRYYRDTLVVKSVGAEQVFGRVVVVKMTESTGNGAGNTNNTHAGNVVITL